MKTRHAVPLAIAVVVCGLALEHATSQAQAPVKPGESVHVYDDPAFTTEHGKVEFSHLRHKELFGQEKLDCKPCHMTKPPLFSMRKLKPGETRETVTMAQMVEGKACGGCHDGATKIGDKVAFDVELDENCTRCHVK